MTLPRNSCYNVFMNHEGISNKQNLVTELPTTSPDFVCRFYLREIARLGKTEDVLNSINQSLESTPALYGSTEEFLAANPDYDEKIDTNLSPDEKKAVKEYSGYSFAWINSVARGFWDYDKMGRKTPEMEEEIKETTRGIVSAIKKAPAPTQDFMTFRGTNLDGFRAYGINSLEDLTRMKGQFTLEQGFTSTALARERSFVEHKENGFWVGSSNIEIHYHIPAGADEVLALTSEDLSYSPGQTEVLIDHSTLNYISDVVFDRDGHAVVDMILVPRSVYDKNA